jgi:hypothetical protein
LPAGQVVDQAAQSVVTPLAIVAVPAELQKPDLQMHAAIVGPPGEPFEFVGHAVQPLAAPATVAGVP